jgi:hypothetical protein
MEKLTANNMALVPSSLRPSFFGGATFFVFAQSKL